MLNYLTQTVEYHWHKLPSPISFAISHQRRCLAQWLLTVSLPSVKPRELHVFELPQIVCSELCLCQRLWDQRFIFPPINRSQRYKCMELDLLLWDYCGGIVLFCFVWRISGSLTTYSRMAKQFYHPDIDPFMAKYPGKV